MDYFSKIFVNRRRNVGSQLLEEGTFSKGKRGIKVTVQEEVKNFLFSDLRKRVKTKGGGRYQGG